MPASDDRYPIGKFRPPKSMTEAERRQAIAAIAAAPTKLREAVKGLSEGQLDSPYREGGWTVRQVVHHVPDSHMNAYVRMKLALTEDRPTIKPYEQERWAELPDSKGPIEPSLAILEALHKRWVSLLQAMPDDAWARTFEHPESGTQTLDRVLAMYAWHGAHHVAHITTLRERKGW